MNRAPFTIRGDSTASRAHQVRHDSRGRGGQLTRLVNNRDGVGVAEKGGLVWDNHRPCCAMNQAFGNARTATATARSERQPEVLRLSQRYLLPHGDICRLCCASCALLKRSPPCCPALQVFISLGLRHLIVVDQHNLVTGIITRKDLDHAAGHGWWRMSHQAQPPQTRGIKR